MSSKEIIRAIEKSDESAFEDVLGRVKEASAEGASFKGLHLGAMCIHDISCVNTEWEACIFDGTSFEGVDLQGAYFNGCTFHECRFEKSVLAEASFDGCVWQKSEISDAEDLEGLEVTNCQFKDCVWRGLQFVDSTLESLTISSGRLEHLSGIADLKSVVLRNVTVEHVDTTEMSLSGCTASGCSEVPRGFTACEGRRRRV